MKSKLLIIACALALYGTTTVTAQEKPGLKKDIERTADTISNKTRKTVKKGVAKVVDKTYADKTGPQGETVYIDKHDRYYYIDGEGRKVYVKKTALKDKAQ